MADKNNPGQFGNRSDTEEQARKGGKASHGGKNTSDSETMSREEAGQRGGQARAEQDDNTDNE